MIETERLLLRPIGPDDRDAVATMFASPSGRRYLGGPRPADEAWDAIVAMMACQAAYGMSCWGVERRADARLIGVCGLAPFARADTPIEGEIEIGWQLAEESWGQGYGLEAAKASLAWGWGHLPAPRIVAITVPANLPSVRLMARLGMTPRPDLDFDHPLFAAGDPLRRHVTYEAQRP
ncbi:GNAT family N-acetyltransferase [Sphingomonas sp. BIUV-7]|uniref:GNAT family N-acetyltransferase n=1 Tax=Sphingomonas natans TaxID=3063330 RepID=A0ABT8YDQ4_9SPHN|nr:GNAT family N-acetyltransferase [Sphingomonas sp. BIUV-7]MDO6416510.1 GNAT family N-acetyltransferase [Sphingomonas sp. BIUV-7]